MSETPPNSITAPVTELVLGTLDVMMALGITLANAGLIRREDLAAEMGRALDQHRLKGETSVGRLYPLQVMEELFTLPVVSGLTAIDGGKKDDDVKA